MGYVSWFYVLFNVCTYRQRSAGSDDGDGREEEGRVASRITSLVEPSIVLYSRILYSNLVRTSSATPAILSQQRKSALGKYREKIRKNNLTNGDSKPRPTRSIFYNQVGIVDRLLYNSRLSDYSIYLLGSNEYPLILGIVPIPRKLRASTRCIYE